MGGVDGEGFFAEDGFVVCEAEHDVLEMVGVRCSDVDDIDVWIFDEFFVRAIGCAWCVRALLFFDHLRDELFGAGFARRAGHAGDEVDDVSCIPGCRVDKDVFDKRSGNEASRHYAPADRLG